MRSPCLSIPFLAILLLGLFAPATLDACGDCHYTGFFLFIKCSTIKEGKNTSGVVRNATCQNFLGIEYCASCGPSVSFSGNALGGSVEMFVDGVTFAFTTLPSQTAPEIAQGLATQINGCEICTFTATAEGGDLTISGASEIGVRILDPGLNRLTRNVPDGEQAGMTTTGALRQLVPALAPGQTCTARFWAGKRSDGGGTWGSWYLQLTSGPWVENLLNGFLSFQSVEWQQYQKPFMVPAYFPAGTISLQLTGYAGFESYDLVELDCGGGNLIVNGSFEIPAILDGRWSAFSNPSPAFWTVIPGAGPFNPNEVQLNNVFP